MKPPTWSDVKKTIAEFDRAGLIGLVQDLHGLSKENQAFLYARFSLSGDVLAPYKAIVSRWLWPSLTRNQTVSVATAKKAMVAYKKAVGDPEGMAELAVFYCEQAAGFGREYGPYDTGYYDALIRMFEQTLKMLADLPADRRRDAKLARLDVVRRSSHQFGYGVGDDMDSLLARYNREGK